jgi:uncharacterized membrane protein
LQVIKFTVISFDSGFKRNSRRKKQWIILPSFSIFLVMVPLVGMHCILGLLCVLALVLMPFAALAASMASSAAAGTTAGGSSDAVTDR